MKKILIALFLLIQALPLMSQLPPPSSTFGLSQEDEKSVKEMRYKMAQIKKRRPTVALVLSGGGAKGAATVGALKFLEQYEIPIDMVVGTSIGGLVGGMYALGYSPEYLDSLFKTMDWQMALSDKVDDSFIPYSRRRYREKFLLSFPFFYREEDYKDFLEGDLPFAGGKSRRLKLGADESNPRSVSDVINGNLLGSLPSGFVFGQNVNHIISSRTVGYSDSTNFFSLPIPYACVATDLPTSKAKIWHSGSMNLAMRSTMSIPGLFAPVRTEGMVLVDGGMRNNFPVNIAKELGADIVIGIDLATGNTLSAKDIKNLGDILISGMELFANDAYEKNISMVDILIHPDLDGYNMLSFNAQAVEDMSVRGYKAAEEVAPQLEALRKRLGNEKFKLNATPAVDIDRTDVHIGEIEIVGVSEKEAEYLRSKMYVQPNSIVDRKVIENDIASIFGKGAYDYVNYELRGSQEPYKLRILCKRGPMHQLGLGARIDTEDLVSLLLNVGLNTNSIYGSSLDMTARISTSPYIDLLYSYNAPHFSTFNARAEFRYTNRNNFLRGDENYDIAFFLATQELYMSNMHWSQFDVKLGLRNQFLKINRVLASNVVGDYDFDNLSADYLGLFVDGRIETMDDGYFPTRGISLGIRGDAIYRGFDGSKSGKFLGIAQVDGSFPFSFGAFTLIPRANARFIFGKNIPLIHSNLIGGDMRGRYVEQQMPFIGITGAAIRRPYLLLARLDARYRVGKSHYFSLLGNYSYDFDDFGAFVHGESIWGVGAEYAYDSIVGPLKAQINWSSLNNSVGFYVSLGYNF